MKFNVVRRGSIGLLSVVVGGVWAGAALAQAQSKPIVLGFPAAMTGPLSAWDTTGLAATRIAVEKINAAGGVNGRMLELNVQDYASVPSNAVTLGNQLINQGVEVLLGGSGSAANSALLPIAARHNVPLLAVSVLTGDLTWGFSMANLGDNGWEKAEMGMFKDVVKGNSMAVMHFTSPFGQIAEKRIKKMASEAGVKVVESVPFDGFVTSLSNELLRVKESKPDAVATFAGGASHIIMAKGAAGVDLNVPIIFSIDSRQRVMEAMEQYPNIYAIGLSYFAYPDMPDAEMKAACDKLIPDLQKINKDYVYSVSGFAADLVYMYALAAKASGATTGEKLRAALESLAYTGCASRYRFSPADHSGQLSGPSPAVGGQWQKDGSYKVLWRDK